MFNSTFARPRFRPAINVGCLMDIPTGKYELGKHGESILNGGLDSLTGIAARPNNFKTALAVYLLARLRAVCHHAHTITYDTEGTLYPTARFEAVSLLDPYLSQINYEDDPQFTFTDLSQYNGDQFFDAFRKVVNEKPKNEKQYLSTTPFLDSNGKPRQALYPSGALIDSLSKLTVSAVETIYDKNKIGDSGANTDAMTNGKAKNQMMNQIPGVCARTGTYMIMTAHVGDIINLEMYPTDKRNLSYMKKDTVLKGVSSGFYSLPDNLWFITSNKPLLNKEKMPQYPWDNSTALKDDTDLSEIRLMNLRGKRGMSGFEFPMIASQTEGILPSLSEFHYCKENNNFGIGGNLQNYFMELRPEVKLSRTTVRKKLHEDALLRRAVQITSELLQLYQFHRLVHHDLLCDPKTLYDDIAAMGYDWDQLLQTRGYWVFEEEAKEHPQNYLSTMDLLRMRKGLYVPYWLSKEEKAKLKAAAPKESREVDVAAVEAQKEED